MTSPSSSQGNFPVIAIRSEKGARNDEVADVHRRHGSVEHAKNLLELDRIHHTDWDFESGLVRVCDRYRRFGDERMGEVASGVFGDGVWNSEIVLNWCINILQTNETRIGRCVDAGEDNDEGSVRPELESQKNVNTKNGDPETCPICSEPLRLQEMLEHRAIVCGL